MREGTFGKLLEGAETVVTEEELRARLREGCRVKLGVDPTAPELHLGHLVLLRKLRLFQEMGATVVFIIGGFTAQIGDPSGRLKERPPLSEEQVRANASSYREQVLRFLEPEKTEFRDNAEWLAGMPLKRFLELAGLLTTAQVLRRRDFAERLEKGFPLSVREFLYPLLQAYDSVAIQADVEIGGADQLFNLLLGRDLQRALGLRGQVVFTVPLLVGTDGVRKMSKSEGNVIWISDPAEEMFGKLMRIPDETMWPYLQLLTDISQDELAGLRAEVEAGHLNPMAVKERLAEEVVAEVHGAAAARRARERFQQVFRERGFPSDAPEVAVPEGTRILDALDRAGVAATRSEIKRLLRAGAVELEGRKVTDPQWRLPAGLHRVRVGKHRFLVLRCGM